MWCEYCRKDSHQHSYVQYFFNVMSYSLAISQMVGGCASFGETLKDLEGQTTKSCDTDKGDPVYILTLPSCTRAALGLTVCASYKQHQHLGHCGKKSHLELIQARWIVFARSISELGHSGA